MTAAAEVAIERPRQTIENEVVGYLQSNGFPGAFRRLGTGRDPRQRLSPVGGIACEITCSTALHGRWRSFDSAEAFAAAAGKSFGVSVTRRGRAIDDAVVSLSLASFAELLCRAYPENGTPAA